MLDNYQVRKLDVPLLDRPPYVFVPLICILVVWAVLALLGELVIPRLLNIGIGLLLGYPIGRLHAWATINYIATIAMASKDKPWIKTAANFGFPVIRHTSFVARTITVFLLLGVGIIGSSEITSYAYDSWPNATPPWARFHGLSLKQVSDENFGPNLFAYATTVLYITISRQYKWFEKLE